MKKALAILLAVFLLVPMTMSFVSHADVQETVYNINSTSFGGDKSEHVSYVVQSDFLRLDVDGSATSAAGLYGTIVINVAEAGEYDVTLNLRAHESCGKFELFINGSETKQCDVDMRHKEIGVNANTFFDLAIGKVSLVKGDNTFKFVSTGEGGSNTAENNRYKANIRKITIAREVAYSSFSEGSIVAADASANITQQIETDYKFVDETGTDKTSEKTFSSSSTAGYGSNMTVFYDCIKGSYLEYTVNVETAGTYAFSINSRTHMTGFGQFTLSVDGETMGTYNNKAASNTNTMWAEYALGTKALTQGAHTVRFTATGEGAMAYGKENNNCFGADLFTLKQVVTDYTIDSDDFSAFVTSRDGKNANTHDVRFIVAADLAGLDNYDALYMSAVFTDASGNVVKTLVKNVATELEIFESASAAGNQYTAANGAVLFGCVITDIPDADWSNVSLSLGTTADAETIFVKGTLTASEIIG